MEGFTCSNALFYLLTPCGICFCNTAYTLSDSRGFFSNSAVLLTKTTTARFPCSSSSLVHKLNGRLKCWAPNSRPFVCRASSGDYKERFEKWCQTHGVVYGGKEEWMKRFEIYQSNVQRIDYINSLDLSYKLTDNRFTDMTNDEFKARYLGGLDTSMSSSSSSLTRDQRMILRNAAEIHDEPEDKLQAEPEIVSEYEEHDESDYESEPSPVTAILEPESELQLDSYQEEEENVTLDVLSDDDESLDKKVYDRLTHIISMESENSSLERRPAK